MLLGISLTLRNRLVRTRMPGGVRGRGLAAPFYSIFPEGVDHGGCVAFQGFGGAEDGGDEFTGGVVDDGMEGEERAAVYQPGEGGGFERWRNLFLNGGRMGIAWPSASLSKMMG